MKETQPLPSPSHGKLGILLPGMGAVATTLMAGVFLARRGLAAPVGSLTQQAILSPTGPGGSTLIQEAIGLTPLTDVVFGAWDIFPDSALEVAHNAGVLEAGHLNAVADELDKVRPMTGVFWPEYVRRLHGTHIKTVASKADAVSKLQEDIRSFKKANGLDRLVAVWCGSTEVHTPLTTAHATQSNFEKGLKSDDPAITPSQIYAWACVLEGVAFANGSPNCAVDFPAIEDLSHRLGVPIAGKDFKTGQTWMKTLIAPGLKARSLGVRGWFSTNILGNRDGEVLDDPDSFKTKELSKLGVLESILDPAQYPSLYGQMHHKVRIEYYPPRGDAKEGWDNIDLFGWLGYPMQIKVNFLCRDSILAAPIVLDVALLLDRASRSGFHGPQDWLGFYWKSPMSEPGRRPENDIFLQHGRLMSTMRSLSRQPFAQPTNELHALIEP